MSVIKSYCSSRACAGVKTRIEIVVPPRTDNCPNCSHAIIWQCTKIPLRRNAQVKKRRGEEYRYCIDRNLVGA